MHIPNRTSLVGTVGLLLLAVPATAQRIEYRGRGEIETDSVMRRVVAAGAYRLIAQDTVFAPTDTIRGPVIIAATTVKLENVILGDVAIVDANVFMRPHSRITGDVVNIGGGLFRSSTSVIDGSVREWKDALYRAERRPDGVRITATRVATLFDLDGFGGFHAPTYDRVAGLSVSFGARYLLPRVGLAEPEIHGWVGYQTAREKLIGGADAGFRRGGLRFRAGAERIMLTNDAWVKGWSNSISYFLRGHDYRDYYLADRLFIEPSLTALKLDSRRTVRLTAQIEDATSVPGRDPWHAFHEGSRLNPLIDDGRITSATVAFDGEWQAANFAADVDVAIEAAGRLLGGDYDFTRFDIGGNWAMLALSNHTFTLKWRFRGPLGTDTLPRQRWNVLGGRASLYTLGEAELRGDRLAYLQSVYSIPLTGLDLPVFGRPALELVHRVGNAWTAGGDSEFTQNAGLRLRFRFGWIMGMVDPEDTDKILFKFGLSLRQRFPWSPID